MATLDIVILVIMSVGLVSGFMRGLVKELASVTGLIAGLFVARALYEALGERLAVQMGCSVSLAQVVAFLLIWLFIPLILLLFASLLTRIIEVVHLGWLNRWLGSVVGCVKCVLVMGLLIHALDYVDAENELVSETRKDSSLLYYPVKDIAGIFFPVMKNVTIKLMD